MPGRRGLGRGKASTSRFCPRYANRSLSFRLYAWLQLGFRGVMREDEGLDRLADAAIRLHRLAMSYGTPPMQLLSRLLLVELGVELAARRDADAAANDNPQEPDKGDP